MTTKHPRYVAHFTDPLYDDVSDDAAPFGSDQGADMLRDAELAGWTLPPDSTIASLLPWGTVEECFAEAARGDIDGLLLIYAAGFLLLRFEGRISDADREVLLRALEGIVDDLTGLGYGDNIAPITHRVIPDVTSFGRGAR